jgi:beta-lactamase class A
MYIDRLSALFLALAPVFAPAFATAFATVFAIVFAAVFGTAAAICPAGALQQRLPDLARLAHGKVGVAITIAETGETIAGLDGDTPFPMQSVYKLPIAMAVLEQVDQGKLSLEQPVRVEQQDFVSPGQYSPVRDQHPDGVTLPLRELLRLTVAESDGTTSDVVMRLAGGASRIDAYLRGLGISSINVVDTEQAMGRDDALQYRNAATPNGAVALLQALQTGKTLSPTSRGLLNEFLTKGTRGARRIAGRLPPGTLVAHKPGTSGTNRQGVTAATNDIGLVRLPDGRHLGIAVFVSDATADDADRDATIAAIARAAWDCQSQ